MRKLTSMTSPEFHATILNFILFYDFRSKWKRETFLIRYFLCTFLIMWRHVSRAFQNFISVNLNLLFVLFNLWIFIIVWIFLRVMIYIISLNLLFILSTYSLIINYIWVIRWRFILNFFTQKWRLIKLFEKKWINRFIQWMMILFFKFQIVFKIEPIFDKVLNLLFYESWLLFNDFFIMSLL
jgi:hypothetical protein